MKKSLIITLLSTIIPCSGYALECPSVESLYNALPLSVQGIVENSLQKRGVKLLEDVYFPLPVDIKLQSSPFPITNPIGTRCLYTYDKDTIFMEFVLMNDKKKTDKE